MRGSVRGISTSLKQNISQPGAPGKGDGGPGGVLEAGVVVADVPDAGDA